MSDTDYTVTASVSYYAETKHGGTGAPLDVRTRGRAAVLLSKAHIRPQEWPGVIWCEGASVLKVSKGGHCDAVGGGERSAVKGFSEESRRRLMVVIGQVRRDADLPLFITLTYPASFPDVKDSKRHLKMWLQRLARAFPGHGSIWKLEPQDRGAPHYHLLTWGCDTWGLREFVPQAWFEVAGGGDQKHLLWHQGRCGNRNVNCVQQVRSFRGVWSYASKYLGKTFEVDGWQSAGRYWGVVNPGNVPFGEVRSGLLARADAVQIQRYQRRFAHMRARGRSMTTFCDADQWVQKLVISKD